MFRGRFETAGATMQEELRLRREQMAPEQERCGSTTRAGAGKNRRAMGTTRVGDPAGLGELLEAGGERRGTGAAEHEAVREPMKWRFTEARTEERMPRSTRASKGATWPSQGFANHLRFGGGHWRGGEMYDDESFWGLLILTGHSCGTLKPPSALVRA